MLGLGLQKVVIETSFLDYASPRLHTHEDPKFLLQQIAVIGLAHDVGHHCYFRLLHREASLKALAMGLHVIQALLVLTGVCGVRATVHLSLHRCEGRQLALKQTNLWLAGGELPQECGFTQHLWLK